MTTYAAGHKLTAAEQKAAHFVQDFLLEHGEDSQKSSSTSPKGDGRWAQLTEIFPRRPGRGMPGLAGSAAARTNAMRQAVRRLHEFGVLRVFEIAFYGDCVKAVPFEQVEAAEAEAKASHNGGTK